MADNLIFPIGFDLEKGVRDVIAKGDIYLRQIEHAMNRKPIVLRAEVDASKFQMFSRQFTNSIDGISAKLAQAQRLWNAMTFDVKVDADGNLSRRAQVVFDAFQQLTQASATMGQRLGEVNRNLAKSEQDTARAIIAEYDKRRQQTNEHIRLKERQAAAEERVRQSQLKGVNVGYTDTQKQVEAVRNLRLQYEAILPMLNAMAVKRVQIKVGIDKQFEADIQRINGEIARLRQSNLQLGAKGDTNAIQANLQAIRQLEAELQRISQQKIDLLNSNKINADLARLRTEISGVFGELQSAERRLAADNSLNAALDAQSQKVLKLHADIQKLDQQFAQLNATGKAYNQDGSFTAQANTLLQQRIALTKQLEQEAITGQQAQIKLEQQLREEKRQTEQAAKNAAKEAERQAKAEAAARKQAQDAANAENKARQEAYNARRRQGQETQRILNKEAKSIADITAKLQIQQQRLQSANIGSAKFNKIAEEVRRLTADLEKANQKMRELTGQTQSGASRQISAHRQVTGELRNQTTYVERLIKRMAVYTSFSMVGGFLTQIREVTAQFELQRISLGAILQDQNKANQLFSQIKTFALTSPVKILDLTKYTKQLAAYKIGYDELFDTTKRLTDVSVGLGVSMDRVVLAYGQVRATGHLRASEIRQFTEMGVPIVEELAAKLSKLNGETVTAAQVMDMVSKRAISFEMVKEVFNDMTSAGGIFYNMQEKQGNTLYGMWAKLGDAASVMYEQIGNTDSVNNAMKGTIQLLTTLMRNWQATAFAATAAGLSMAGVFLASKFKKAGGISGIAESYRSKMDERATAATERRIQAEQRLATVQKSGTQEEIKRAQASLATASADEKAAIAARQNASAMRDGQAAMRGVGSTLASIGSMAAWGAVVAFISAWVYEFKRAWDEAHRLKNKLKEIETETAVLQSQSVRNFTRVADAALAAPTGSKEQQEKLKELQQTYRDVFDEETLTIENLNKVADAAENGAEKYGKLTDALREYIAEQQRQKALDAIREEIQPKINAHMKELRKVLEGNGYGFEDQTAFTLNLTDISNEAEWAGKTVEEKIREALRRSGIKGSKELIDELMKGSRWDRFIRGMNNNVFGNIIAGGKLAQTLGLDPDKVNTSLFGYIANWTADTEEHANALNEAFTTMNATIDAQNQGYDILGGTLAQYNSLIEQTKKNIEGYSFKSAENTVERDNETINMQVDYWLNALQKAFDDAGVDIDLSDYVYLNEEGFKNVDWTAIDGFIRLLDTRLATPLGGLSEHIQKQFNKFIPSGKFVQHFRDKLYKTADTLGVARGLMRDDLMKSGEDFEAYQKRIKDTIDKVKKNIALLKETIKTDFDLKIAEARKNKDTQEESRLKREKAAFEKEQKENEERLKVLEKINEENEKINPSGKNKGSRKSDPRLQNLKEEISLYEKLYKEYEKYQKLVGADEATAHLNREAKATIDNLAKKYGIGLPKTTTDLVAALEILYGKMEKLPRKAFPNLNKELAEFRWKIENIDIDASQNRIEAQLKALSEKISRTKTAKEFYEKILEQTGDINIATRVSMSVYGSTGEELFNDTVEQIREAFKTGSEGHPIDLDISAAIDVENQRIDYKKLADIYDKYQDEIIEKRRDTAKKIATEGQKEVAADILNWRKSLAKAKSYEQKRTDIINTATAERAKIIRETTDPKERGELLGLSYSKQAQELAKLAVDEFKSSDDYIKVFQDLDRVSTQTLDRMKKRLEEMIATVKDTENVEGLKTLVEQLDKIKEERETRNPIEGIIDSFKEYAKARKDYRTAEAEEAAAKAEFAQQEVGLNQAIQTAKAEQTIAQQRVNDLKAQGKENTAEGVAAELVLNEATKKVAQATENRNKAVKKVNNAEQKTTDALDAQKAALAKLQKNVNAMANAFNSAASSIKTIADMMGVAEDSELGDMVNGLVDGLNNAATIMTTILAIAIAIESACWWLLAIGAAVAAFSAIGSWLTGSKVRKANKEIERQQKLLDQLEYTYGRLEKAAERAFGSDYIDNYRQRMQMLQAQQTAYLKMAEAERSKGKKEDKAKTQEYLNSAREAADKIADMEGELAERIMGTDVASAAREFANAWLDAYLSFENTADAIKGKFRDLIKNMVVESYLAKVMQNEMQPIFDMIDDKLADGYLSEQDAKSLVSSFNAAEDRIDRGLQARIDALEMIGFDLDSMRDKSDNATGIAKSVSGATSEEINNVAAIGNTLMYYVSPIPQIDANLARVVALMEGSAATSAPSLGGTDYTEMLTTANEHLSSLPRMEQHLSEIHALMRRIVTEEGGRAGVRTYLRQ